jgi:hypothetical protein
MTERNTVPYWLDFQGIAASVRMALQRATQALQTGDLLRLAAFTARTIPADSKCKCEKLRAQLLELQPDHLHALGRELRRSTLTTAIGVLDFCLFEVLVLMVSIRPDALARLPKDFRRGEEPLNAAKESLRRTGIERRLKLVAEVLQISIAESMVEDLKPLLARRHDITHQSKFYEFVPSGPASAMKARAFPEVSHEESLIALMTVSDITDCVLAGVSEEHFKLDLGDLRPVTPGIAEVHRVMREQIAASRERGPKVETIDGPGWRVVIHEGLVCVIDKNNTVAFSATGIERLPLSIFCPKHDVHGETACVTIDAGDNRAVGFMEASFVAELLLGSSILVEYHSMASDAPIYAHLSLGGLAERWAEAQAKKAAQARK